MDLQFKTFPFEVKSSATDGSTFAGLVSVFNNIDSYNEIVDEGAFDEDLPEFMAEGFIGGLNHNWDDPIGTPQVGTKVVDKGLLLHGNVIDTTHGMDVRKMLKAGVVKKLSIGFRTLGAMMLETADDVKAYWEKKGYTPNADDMARCEMGARVLTRIKLFEGSPVTVAANNLAFITAVKAAREAADNALREHTLPTQTDTADKPEEATEEPERLISIRSIANRSEAEDILRNAGFSRTERAAFISAVKALPRNAASDDADTDATDAGDVAQDDAADHTEPNPEDAPDTTETLTSDTPVSDEVAEDDKPDNGEAIVTGPPPPSEALSITVEFESANAAQLAEEKQKTARTIAQRQALLDAQLDIALERLAGR